MPPPPNRSEKFEFDNGRGQTLAGRLELPADGSVRAVALFAHCFTCGKDIAAATRISRALAARGFAVLRFDFTGLGSSEGEFANESFSSNVGDLGAAAGALETRHGEGPTLLVGHSLGGAAVLLAAGEIDSVRAVATIGAPSEPAHVEHLLTGARDRLDADGEAEIELAGRRFRITRQFVEDLQETTLRDRVAGLGKAGKAVLLMHSPLDEIVGIDHARRLYMALHHPKSFVSLDDADHLLSRREDAGYVAELLTAWSSRYLPPAAATSDAAADHGEPGMVAVVELDGGLAQRIVAGGHVLRADEPASVPGGSDSGPTPYGYLLAALGACTSMTLRMYARHKKLPLTGVEVRLRHDRIHADDCEDCEKQEGRIDVIERAITLHGDLDDEVRQRMLEIADRCPVHRTLENEIKVRTSLD